MWITSVYVSKTYKTYKTAKMNLPREIREIILKNGYRRAIIERIDERTFKVKFVTEEEAEKAAAEHKPKDRNQEERGQGSREQ